jgi:tetratricopeptide (TPR) repeat protein
LYKSVVLRKLNRPEEALIAIEQAISLQNNNANLYSERGNILSNLKRYAQAEIAINQAIKLNPRSVFYNNRGVLYEEQGKPELAIADYNQAIALNPNHAEAYGNLGLLYEKIGNTKAARSNSQKAQELFTAQGRTADAEQAANFLQQLP